MTFCIVAFSETGYDIIFMFDGTSSSDQFRWMKGFASSFVTQMAVDSGEFRFGAVVYGREQKLMFNLNTYGFSSDLKQAVTSRIDPTPGGKPDLAGAFDFVRQNMFTAANGDRPKARNFVVLMTSNDKSLNTEAAVGGSRRLQIEGIGIYSVGMKVKDTAELDKVTTPPLDEYQTLIDEESQLGELPGIMSYYMAEGV